MRRVYLYSLYERIWHWSQAAIILGFLVTGLEIHAPERFGPLGFATALDVHTALGFFLVVNGFLGLFYQVTSGGIRQYLPEPRDFVSLAAAQARYYLFGIFRKEPHPFEKSRGRRLNPLQRLTYLVILNVLLPLQIVTGFLLFGGLGLGPIRDALGGLPVLVPIHAAGAWLFAAFIVMHVYLTTTGTTPTASLRAMLSGWEEFAGDGDPKDDAARGGSERRERAAAPATKPAEAPAEGESR